MKMTDERALELLNQPLPKLKRGVDLCAEYKKAKGPLEASLYFLNFIPVYGKKIAGWVMLVMTVADSVCDK